MPQSTPGGEVGAPMNETRRLAEFVHDTHYADLPKEVVEACRVFLLDSLASALVGARTPWAKMVRELAAENGGAGPCSMLGTGETASASYAALANGTAIAGFETDQAFYPGSCHPGAVVLPALLAAAQRERVDGRRFLEALALGYEAVCRIGLAAGRAVEDKAGFHGPGTNGPFGGAMGAGKAMGLGVEGLVNALGIAGSQGAGLMEFAKTGAMTKRLHLGRAAQTGLESALLSEKGFTGPNTVLEGERGFLRVYSPTPDPTLLIRGLGSDWALFGIGCKGYACHLSFHPVIDSVVKFRKRSGVGGGELEGVKVAINSTVVRKHGQKAPTTILGAQYSLPFSVAIALLRDVEDPDTFNESTLWDEDVRALAERVEPEARETGSSPMAIIVIRSTGKEYKLEARDWKGAPSNPYTFGEMSEKFKTYASASLAPGAIEEAIRRVDGLEDARDAGELAMLLTPDPQRETC